MKPREAAMYRRRKAATGVRALVTCSIAVERQQAIAKQLEEAIERAREGVSARARPQHGDPEQQLREADTGEVAFRRPARSTRPHGGIWRRARAPSEITLGHPIVQTKQMRQWRRTDGWISCSDRSKDLTQMTQRAANNATRFYAACGSPLLDRS